MRVAVMVLAYSEAALIRPVLQQVPAWVGRVLLLTSQSPWNGIPAEASGALLDTARDLERRNARIEVVRLDWRTEHDQRNWGLGRLSQYDWVIVLDTDEFLTQADWEKLREELDNAPMDAGQVRCRMTTYWKSLDYRFDPPDSHLALMAIRPMSAVFVDKRDVGVGVGAMLSKAHVHHLSWVRTDREAWEKVHNWSHADDFDKEAWYNEKWLKWSPDMEGLRPYGTELTTKAILDPAPDEIKAYFA